MLDLWNKNSDDVHDLVKIVRVLRAPGGCPWDAEQTHASLRRNLLEEAYEAVEAIDQGSLSGLKEELGDVLLQVVFHASIEEDAGQFNLNDVADGVCRKLIFRHPHVFGRSDAHSTQEVLANWDELKKQEKGQRTQADTLDAVARSLPALWRAEKMQKKAAQVGFDWPEVSPAMDKLEEETRELRQALTGQGDALEELGDVLFAAVKVGRFLGLDPEEALHACCEKFANRFRLVEAQVCSSGRTMDAVPLSELSDIWNSVKHTTPGT